MRKGSNFFDLVERAAARRAIPRLELWERTATALLEGELLISNSAEWPEKRLRGWLRQFREAVNRGNDPSRSKGILNSIPVPPPNFEKWLLNAPRGPRGPQPGTTGYQAVDRKLFPKIDRLIRTGRARSPYGAALLIADQIVGSSDEKSKAKRVSKLYRKDQK
jgi:hypothetical protein